MTKTWRERLPITFTFMEPSYCETCGYYGISLDIDLAGDFSAVHGEWGCTGGFGWYPESTYSGAELYQELIEAGYDEHMKFDKNLDHQRSAWRKFLAEIKGDTTEHAVPDYEEEA